jgi:hypothetical protein
MKSPSSQKIRIQARSVNGHVAANAFSARLKSQPAVRNLRLRVKSGVALQAQLAAFAPHQKHAIGTSMRVMAGNASFDFYGRVLEYKRPALLHVALDAGFRSRIVQARHVSRAMRIVAVRTLHQTFRNAVVLGQRKLRLNGLMACEAQSRFREFEQTVMPPAGVIREMGKLEKITLRIAQISLAGVFHFFHQVRGVAFAAGNPVASVLRVLE